MGCKGKYLAAVHDSTNTWQQEIRNVSIIWLKHLEIMPHLWLLAMMKNSTWIARGTSTHSDHSAPFQTRPQPPPLTPVSYKLCQIIWIGRKFLEWTLHPQRSTGYTLSLALPHTPGEQGTWNHLAVPTNPLMPLHGHYKETSNASLFKSVLLGSSELFQGSVWRSK